MNNENNTNQTNNQNATEELGDRLFYAMDD